MLYFPIPSSLNWNIPITGWGASRITQILFFSFTHSDNWNSDNCIDFPYTSDIYTLYILMYRLVSKSDSPRCKTLPWNSVKLFSEHHFLFNSIFSFFAMPKTLACFFSIITIFIFFHYSWFTVFSQFSTAQHGDPVTYACIHSFFLTLSCSIISD